MIPETNFGPEEAPLPQAPPGADYYYEQDHNGELYAVFPRVPVFDEHEGRDGTKYDRELLGKIADNCNMRTADTGDKCPIVGWHTPEDKDPHKMPPVIGWAEYFRVEDFGKTDTRACIYSKFRVFADQLKYFLRHPRRSVEIWKGKNPEDRFFDPIAVLGAETPKRDLGLVYSRSDNGDESEHYSMPAFPGGGNTMVPGGAEAKKETPNPKQSKGPEGYEMDNNPETQTPNEMRLSKESIGQIIEALKPTIQDMVQQEMVSKSEEPKMEDELQSVASDESIEEVAEEINESPEPPAAEAPSQEMPEGEEDGKDRNAKADKSESKEDYLAPLAAAALQAAPALMGGMGGGDQNAEDEKKKEVETKDDTDEEEDNALDHLIAELKKNKEGEGKKEPADMRKDGEEAEKNSADEESEEQEDGKECEECEKEKCECKDKHSMEAGKRLMTGMKDKYGEDYEAMAGYMRSMDEADRNAVASYGSCKSCSGEDYALYEKLAGCGKKESYAAEASEEAVVERFEREAGEQLERYAALERESQERYEALERESAEKYAALERESQERYSELNERYSRAMDEITELKSDVIEARTAERYSKIEKEITGLASDGYVVDVEKEVKYCMTLTEEQYSEHVGERIPEMYRRAPIGPIIPVAESPELKVSTGDNLSEKYARSAKEVVLNDRSKSFKEVLDWMVSNDSSEYPSV